MHFPLSKKAFLWVALIIAIAVGIIVAVIFTNKNVESSPNTGYRTGSIVSNGRECAKIGAKFMEDGGSVVDVAIGTLLCEGAMVGQSMGLGGGFVGVIYTKPTNKIETIIARESAPAAARQDMFINRTSSSTAGALFAGVPGEIKGYWEMHQKYGKLPWSSLFPPTIKLCREGVYVSPHMQKALLAQEQNIRDEPSMAEIFIKPDGSIYREGEYLKRPQLADTLEKLAAGGADAFYNGELGKLFAEDVQSMGGIITQQDLKNYKIRWSDKNHMEADIMGNYKLYTTPLPTSGILLRFMLQVLNGMFTSDMLVYLQRVVESFKHAYGLRTKLGDAEHDPEAAADIKATASNLLSDDFIKSIRAKIHDDSTSQDYSYYGAEFSGPNDHGTANVAVLAHDGSAIVITSTVNNYFGCKRRSQRTGIILNDEMDDFATPGVINSYGLRASPANYIYPNKVPLSSMCPSIILDKNGDVRMLVGAAGGSRITSAVATAVIRYLLLNYNMTAAVNDPRLHHQLAPMRVSAEPDVDSLIVDHLRNIGHVVDTKQEANGFAAITGIGALNAEPVPVFDKRRLGSTITIAFKNKMQH